MRVLAVNVGSSSLKASVVDMAAGQSREPLARVELPDWDGTDLTSIGELADQAEVVAHRIVHGGQRFSGPTHINDSTLAAIQDLTSLAPLHQRRCLAAVQATHAVAPQLPAIACFDTAFHNTIPEAAATYAIPRTWRDLGVRRFGFHGLSHSWATSAAAAQLGKPIEETQMVTAHLGAGASLCAVSYGRSVDTTMGFTPLEGLVMATRSGSVDPGALLWLATEHGIDAETMADALERRSGLAAFDAGNPSGDLQQVLAATDAGDPSAGLAYDIYNHRIRTCIAAMAASLERLDAVVFTGGVGENSERVRGDVAAGLGVLGLGSQVPVLVVVSREDLQMASEAQQLLAER